MANRAMFQHVDAVIKHHQASMADQAILGGEGFIVKRRIEKCAREIRAKWTTDLHGLDRAASSGAAADIIDYFAKCEAKGSFEQPAHV